MFYGQGSNTTPQWRTYQQATNTFGAASGTAAGDTVRSTTVRTSPIKQEAIAGYVSATGVLQIMCYNGTSWTNDWSINVGGTGSTKRFGIAYETATGDAMVVYSTNVSTTNEMAYRTKPGSSSCGAGNWSGATNLNPTRTSGVANWVRLESSPVAGSNTIGLAWSDTNADLSAMEWTGTSWAVAEPTTTLETNLESASAVGDVQSFDMAFESQTGNLMIVWGVSTTSVACTAGSNCLRYARYTTSWSAATAIPTVADGGTSIDISANPNTNELVMAAIDNGPNTTNESDLSIGYWSGSAWTGRANQDTTTATPVAGTKLVATGWLINGSTTRSVVVYNDAAATNIGYFVGSGSTYTAQTDATPTPAFANPQKWYDIQTNPFQKDQLMLTVSDNNADVFAKRLQMSATPAFTWTNADGGAALEANLGQATSTPFSFAYWRFIPPLEFDGQIVYPQSTNPTPYYRTLTNATNLWSSQGAMPTHTTTNRQLAIESSPTRQTEMISVNINASGTLQTYLWNGSTWVSQWTATTGLNHTIRAAIAYENISGDAVVVYSKNVASTNEMAYRVWNGTSWSGETTFNTTRTSGVVEYVVAKSRPGTDEIAVAWADANRDLSVAYWNGSTLGNEPAAPLETTLGSFAGGIDSAPFDIAFETYSGRLMAVWGKDEAPVANVRYALRSAGPSGTWGATTTGAGFTGLAQMVHLKSDPDSDAIAYVNHSNWNHTTSTANESTQGAVWNGNTWTLSGNYASSGPSVGELDVGVDWLKNGTTSWAVFTLDAPDTPNTGIDYFVYTSTGFSPAPPGASNFNGSPAGVGGFDRAHRIATNPMNRSEAMVFWTDYQSDLWAKKVTFTGSSLSWSSTDPGGTTMQGDIPNDTATSGWLFDFAYKAYAPFVGALNADIVNESASSVASPMLNMANTVISPDCQTTSGTFGVSSQKIRIRNTTTTPGWTLSLAATGGASANWSSGTATYDFNDSSGTPAGCTDGADADSLAGQLGIDPSTASITPQSGCNVTGVTLGSSSAFSQGSVNSITLLNGGATTQTSCYWDLTGVGLSQKIPASQASGNYSINMTVTAAAS